MIASSRETHPVMNGIHGRLVVQAAEHPVAAALLELADRSRSPSARSRGSCRPPRSWRPRSCPSTAPTRPTRPRPRSTSAPSRSGRTACPRAPPAPRSRMPLMPFCSRLRLRMPIASSETRRAFWKTALRESASRPGVGALEVQRPRELPARIDEVGRLRGLVVEGDRLVDRPGARQGADAALLTAQVHPVAFPPRGGSRTAVHGMSVRSGSDGAGGRLGAGRSPPRHAARTRSAAARAGELMDDQSTRCPEVDCRLGGFP